MVKDLHFQISQSNREPKQLAETVAIVLLRNFINDLGRELIERHRSPTTDQHEIRCCPGAIPKH